MSDSGTARVRAPAHLRRGDDHRPIDVCRGQVLDDREVLVRRPRRGVHNEVVNLSPVHVAEELLDHACKEESAPLPAACPPRCARGSAEAPCVSVPCIRAARKSGAFGNSWRHVCLSPRGWEDYWHPRTEV